MKLQQVLKNICDSPWQQAGSRQRQMAVPDGWVGTQNKEPRLQVKCSTSCIDFVHDCAIFGKPLGAQKASGRPADKSLPALLRSLILAGCAHQ
jgi:hypothetical protein